jgi:hypothetical protein
MEKMVGGGSVTLYLFFYILPGLLGSIVYDYTLEGERRDNVDRIATALVLTLLSSVILNFTLNTPVVPTLEVHNDTRIDVIINAFYGKNLLHESLLSTFLGLGFAVLNNHGWTYALLRFLRITYKTGDADVWQEIFYKQRGYWIILQYKDGRSLVGWPKYFSPSGKPREVFVADATWWVPDDSGTITTNDVRGPGVYISDFTDIIAIEMLE